MKEARYGARNWSLRVEEQEDRTFRIGSPNMMEPVGKQQGPLDQGCTALGELHWAFKKDFPRRSENRPSRNITAAPVSAGTNHAAQGDPEMEHLGSHLGRWGIGPP